MSTHYKLLPPPMALPKTMQISGATCDVCGEDAYYPAHRRSVAILSRVRDDGISNFEIWDIDLCMSCKGEVMELLHDIAIRHDRTMPDERSEHFDR